MSKTPLTDAILCQQGFSTLDEATDCLNQWVEAHRKLETDRAELVEKANLLLTALSASRANPVFANIVDQRADDLAALLARLEAE